MSSEDLDSFEGFGEDDEEFQYPSDLDSFGEADADGDIWLQETQEREIEPFDFQPETSSSKFYVCLTPESIIKRQQDAIETVNNILPNIPMSSVRVLLQRFNWDAMKLLNVFTETPEKVCKEVGIPLPSKNTSAQTGGTEVCPICWGEEELVKVPCGHAFCRECWNQHLSMEVKEQKQIIMCCGKTENDTCKMVLDEFIVMTLLEDKEQAKLYQKALMKSFVEDNPACKWCPAPGCENAILLLEASGDKNEVVTCECSHVFCFRCLEKDHRPCSCRMISKWNRIHGGENTQFDEGYVATFSRPCPKCHVPIEKNQGCNHMTCKCGYHFCWTCMGKFGSGTNGGSDGYSSHKCNGIYVEDQATLDKKAELERFAHYSSHYESHVASARLETKMLVDENKIIGILKREGFLGNDFSPSVHQILQNRLVLRNSYVFGYYRASMAEYVNKGIFENLQLDVERHTEYLSQLADNFKEEILKEKPEDIENKRQELVNQTRIAAKVLDALLDASSQWSHMADEAQGDLDDENPENVNNPTDQDPPHNTNVGKKRSEKSSFYSKSLDKLRDAERKQKKEKEPKPKKKRKLFTVLSRKK